MGRTFEAFERAKKESRPSRTVPSPDSMGGGFPPPPPVVLRNPVAVVQEDVRESPDTRPLEAPVLALDISSVDQYEELKSAVLTGHLDGAVRSILFTSTANGEGSSTTAIHFAAALAKDPQLNVLLIDANLRTPGTHKVLQVHNGHGLSDLSDGNGCKSYPVKVGAGILHVIPCGWGHSDPIALIESERFDQLLKGARDNYDYVVVDAPPILGFAECRVLCGKVDGVVMVIEHGKTRLQVAMSAKKQLEEAGGKILGVVLNKRRYYIPGFIYRRL